MCQRASARLSLGINGFVCNSRSRDRRRLFGRFARGATSATGTGLGLYLVDQVAQAHGGGVDVVSREGQGCTFSLRLPRHPPAVRGGTA